MRASSILVGVLAAAVATSQCGGGDGDGGSTTNPGPTTPTVVAVSIMGTVGNKSYVPNPVPVNSGQQVVFQNTSTDVHHIVMDDRSVDFGTLSPGASSQARTVISGSFHCDNHPSMVGSFNTAAAPEPPPGSGDGY